MSNPWVKSLFGLSLLGFSGAWAIEYVPPPTFYFNTGSSGYPTMGGYSSLVGWEYTGNPSDYVLNPTGTAALGSSYSTGSWITSGSGYGFGYGQGHSPYIYGFTQAYGFGQPRPAVLEEEKVKEDDDLRGPSFLERYRELFGRRSSRRWPIVDSDRSIPGRDSVLLQGGKHGSLPARRE